MNYPLAAIAVDEEELNLIQTPIVPVILQKLGVNRNMFLPTVIRHGPPESAGGLALLDLRTNSVLKQSNISGMSSTKNRPLGNSY
jgi:hypothetical protein